MSKGVSFVSLTGVTRSAGGLCCRGGRFGNCPSGEDGVVVTALDMEGGVMDGGAINTLSWGEVAVLESISGVGSVCVCRSGEASGVLEFVASLRGNISAGAGESIWLCVGVKMTCVVGN